MTNRKKGTAAAPKRSHLDIAGAILREMAQAQARCSSPTSEVKELPNALVAQQLATARRHLAKADLASDPHRYRAAKEALEALEAIERGKEPLACKELFESYVEAYAGGPRTLDLGGRHQPLKLASSYYRRLAAAIKLWEKFPKDRDQLVKDAVELGIVGDTKFSRSKNKEKLRRKVDNFKQRSDGTPGEASSPAVRQWDSVSDLIDNHGYRRLADFE